MEFGKKIQKLRKENNLTQEQLAEKIFVSRTAISKWESGRGYPNIDSLKDIATTFNTSIDELLSSEEIINISTNEKKSLMNKIVNLCYGIFDIISILFIFIPLYPYSINNIIYSVSLINQNDLSETIKILNIILLSIFTLIGIIEIILNFIHKENIVIFMNITSLITQIIGLFLFAISRQSYLTALILIIFIFKIILLIKNLSNKHKIQQ